MTCTLPRLTAEEADPALAGPGLLYGQSPKEMGTGYDVVVANIVSDVIIALAPAVRGLMKEDGRFLASGIIDSREEEVRAALEAAGLAVEEARASEGWVSFLCR